VIENYQNLKEELIAKGYHFKSDTDSEVIAHLISDSLKRAVDVPGQPNLRYLNAVKTTLARLRGTYGLAIAFRDKPSLMIAARFGSPLVIGVGRGEYFLSSDASPLMGRTDRIVYLADHQVAVLTPEGFSVVHRDQEKSASIFGLWKPTATMSAWMASTTTCSRRSTSNQSPSAMRCEVAWTIRMRLRCSVG
jgi:glucosamine--fructose-6-phosphate aminotransferase (isomerizing)